MTYAFLNKRLHAFSSLSLRLSDYRLAIPQGRAESQDTLK